MIKRNAVRNNTKSRNSIYTFIKPSKKDQTNWFYILLGLFFCFSFVWLDNNDVAESELSTKTIVVRNDIQKVRRKYAYRLGATEYECSFVIKTAASMAAQKDQLKHIAKNDTLIIKIHNTRLADLNTKSEDIPIYSLIRNRSLVYDTDGYNYSQKVWNKRWNTIYITMGLLFLLRGMSLITSKLSYILAGASAAIILTIRLLNIW